MGMDQKIFKIFKRKVILNNPKHLKVSRKLGKKVFCYVLITCDEPGEDGRMQVEMSYEGEQILASYLVKTALQILEQ